MKGSNPDGLSDNIILGIISISIILVLFKFEMIPSAIILTFFGVFLIFFTGSIELSDIAFNWPTFQFHLPTLENLLIGMILAGIAQLFLTLTNVMIATVSLIKDLFPEKEDPIDANSLAFNMGAMNLINPLGGYLS